MATARQACSRCHKMGLVDLCLGSDKARGPACHPCRIGRRKCSWTGRKPRATVKPKVVPALGTSPKKRAALSWTSNRPCKKTPCAAEAEGQAIENIHTEVDGDEVTVMTLETIATILKGIHTEIAGVHCRLAGLEEVQAQAQGPQGSPAADVG